MKRQKQHDRRGFTLVELIVVLVILAILASLLVPALTGYIDKAREQAAFTECRAVVVASQTIASEYYGKGETFALDPEGKLAQEICNLAEVSGTIVRDRVAESTYKVEKVVYKTAGGIYVTYTAGDSTPYVIGNSETIESPAVQQEFLTTVKSVIAAEWGTDLTKHLSVDSGAINVSGVSGISTKVYQALLQSGLDVTDMGATMWQYRTASEGNYYTARDSLNWTIDDVSTVAANERVRYIRYSDTYGYSVGTVELIQNSNGYLAMNTSGYQQVGGNYTTYEDALQAYNNLSV